MDNLFKLKCNGSTACFYTKTIQRGLLNTLQCKDLLPKSVIRQLPRIHLIQPRRSFSVTPHLPNTPSWFPSWCSNVWISMTGEIATLSTEAEGVSSLNITRRDEVIEEELKLVQNGIMTSLGNEPMAKYYFQESGKMFRPRIVLTMSAALAAHSNNLQIDIQHLVSEKQRRVGEVCQMIHTASLVHDDVIDNADTRRSLPSINTQFGNKKSILIGDFILAKATQLLCAIEKPEIIKLLAQVIEDLVKGEFMQMGERENFENRFAHYMEKTFKKTASLFAHSCQAVAALSSHPELQQVAFEYGKHIGLAFQIMDDLLDFTGTESSLGKPAGQDLSLGLSTAPVLFASRQYPELESLIKRGFTKEGDVQRALEMVHSSQGLQDTKRYLMCFCFVPAERVIGCFETLQEAMLDESGPVVDYWERNYIGIRWGRARRQPRLAETECRAAVRLVKENFPDSPFRSSLTEMALGQLVRTA